MTSGNTCNPDRVVELCSNNNPAVPSWSGPCMPVRTAYTPISGDKTSRAEAKRSNFPPPDVPWDNQEIVGKDCEWGSVLWDSERPRMFEDPRLDLPGHFLTWLA